MTDADLYQLPLSQSYAADPEHRRVTPGSQLHAADASGQIV
jgi:hypothetical protein